MEGDTLQCTGVDVIEQVSGSGELPIRSKQGWTKTLAFGFGNGRSRHLFLSLIDQAIVSGTSFLTTLLIGRVCGAEELGVYSLAFTLIVLGTNLQTAVFSMPYTIYGNRLTGSVRHEYAGSVLMHCLMLMALSSICLVLVAIGLTVMRPEDEGSLVIWMLVGAMPMLLLREFVRRFAFAHLRISVVLALDSIAAAIQLGGLWVLVQSERLSAVNVYAVMGLACAIAGGGTLALMRGDFSICWQRILPELRKSWLLGRWIAATRVAALVQTYAVYWLLAAALGTAATGVYTASMTLLLAANPFVIGIGNLLEPQAARAMADGGVKQLRLVVWKATRLLGSVMGLYCGVLFLCGGWLVAVLYSGDQYEHQGPTVAVLALAILVNAWETGAIHGLRVLERPDLSFRASLLSLTITLTLAILLIRPFGTFGGALAVLAGDAAAATVRWIAFTRLSKAALGNATTAS